jgi:hypothetical protein
MNKTNLAQEGGCRCGQVRIKVSSAPFLTMACHCTGCQRMTARAFSLSAAIPSQGFRANAHMVRCVVAFITSIAKRRW